MKKSILALCALLLSCDGSTDPESGTGPVSTVPYSVSAPALRIEEICPGNSDLKDERGEDPGWAEISNPTVSPVAMGAYRFRDGAVGNWRLPDSVIAPGGRQVVFFSGLDRRRIVPAGDTVSVFTSTVYLWSDSMNGSSGKSVGELIALIRL